MLSSLIKNIIHKNLKDKYLVLAVDDYGSVVNDSILSQKNIRKTFELNNRFSEFDGLETTEDIEQLIDVLSCFKDKRDNHPCFSAFCLTGNPDFNKIINSDFEKYFYERLDITIHRLENIHPKKYKGLNEIRNQAFKHNFLSAELHGQEHLNITLFNNLLKSKNKYLINLIKNKSFFNFYQLKNNVKLTASFDLEKFNELKLHRQIIKNSIEDFKLIYNKTPQIFNIQGGYSSNRLINNFLFENGIKFIESSLVERNWISPTKKQINFYYPGKKKINQD